MLVIGVITNTFGDHILLLNTQMVFLFLSNSYIVLIFLDNIDSIHGLSGRVVTYTIIALVTVVVSFLPINRFRTNLLLEVPAFIVLVLGSYYAIVITGGYFSPFYGYKNLYSQYRAEKNAQKRITSIEANAADFYNESVSNYRKKESDLPEQPNVVLIFTEGLSQHIVDDERDIMPCVKTYEEKSLFFKNYYNQTAATYRGLSAQLYSGFQFQNYDKNELISIQDIFENEGYDTTFINAEPENAVFTKYLQDMNFNN